MSSREIIATLIVEDDPRLQQTLQAALADRVGQIHTANGVAQAQSILSDRQFDLVLLDVALPDGDAFDVLKNITAHTPMPVVIAMSGTASPDESFRLAQLGVRGYLAKPLALDKLEQAIDASMTDAPNLEIHVRSAVGHVPIKDLEDEVRRTMVHEALARTGGSKKAAAAIAVNLTTAFAIHPTH